MVATLVDSYRYLSPWEQCEWQHTGYYDTSRSHYADFQIMKAFNYDWSTKLNHS